MSDLGRAIDGLERAAVEHRRAEIQAGMAFVWSATDAQRAVARERLEAASAALEAARAHLHATIEAGHAGYVAGT